VGVCKITILIFYQVLLFDSSGSLQTTYAHPTLSGKTESLLYNWWFTTNQFILALSLLRIIFFFSTEPLWSIKHRDNFTFAFTIIALCNIHSDKSMGLSFMNRLGLTAKLQLVLTSTVILGSESYGTHDHILLADGPGSLQLPPLMLACLLEKHSPVQ
jgi:hypothetical protein